MEVSVLNSILGNVDIYLLDQILKSRFSNSMKILDAGCGEGRNLVYFLHQGFDVYGIDENPVAIKYLKTKALSIDKSYGINNFIVGDLRKIEFTDGYFEVIISSAVLHFCRDTADFLQMFAEMMRVLSPKGILFLRMCSDVGMTNIRPKGNGIYELPDGSNRFLLTQEIIRQLKRKHPFEYLEPYKSVIIENQRSMGTLVIRKL